jgi:hypothetical protein
MNWKVPRRQFLATAGTAATATPVGESVLPLKSTDPRRNTAGSTRCRQLWMPTILCWSLTAKRSRRCKRCRITIHWGWHTRGDPVDHAPPPLTSWDNCEHGTDFFWSWHRSERIIRKFSGEPCWALPYWNWAPGTELRLPAPFRDTTSELYTVNRDPLMNNGAASLRPGGCGSNVYVRKHEFYRRRRKSKRKK